MDDSTRSPPETIDTDIEHNCRYIDRKRQGHDRFYKVPIPFRNGYLASDLLKLTVLVMSALCIFEFYWIRRIQGGMVRIANDVFDNTFHDVDRQSPAIWQEHQQALIRHAVPVPIHSHNDYWRRIPLFEALGSGCISVEADVHLLNSELYVGHESAPNKEDTLRSMYLEPLQRLLEMRNEALDHGKWRGIFDHDPKQTVHLLIDVKTSGPETIEELNSQLRPLRDLDFLTYWNGTDRISRPLAIVASGNTSFETIISLDSNHRDIFWDAKLESLVSVDDNLDVEPPTYVYNRSNSYFASTNWENARLFSWPNIIESSPSDRRSQDLALSQIEQAKARGLISRYWDTPSGPPNLQEVSWRVLLKQGVGLLNMDDMGAVRARAAGWGNIEP